MLKRLCVFLAGMLFTVALFAAGPSQIWRLEVVGSGDTFVEIAEFNLLDETDTSVIDLIRSYTHTEPTEVATWTISHNLGIQTKNVDVDVLATDALDDPVEPTAVNIIDTDTVEILFAVNAKGSASIRGVSFDTPAVNRPGEAVPPIDVLPNRPSAAMFDGNVGSKFKSERTPTERAPLAIQYTYWVGDPDRYPIVKSYTLTAISTDTAPRGWRLLYWTADEGWVLADQQAELRFGNGETRVFEID